MNKMTRGLSYLIGASFEALAILIGATLLAGWLDQNHPIAVKWIVVLLPLSLVVVAHTFYVVLRAILRMERATDKKVSSGSNDGS